MSKTQEIQYLGLMLTATAGGDKSRLTAILTQLNMLNE